MRPQFQNEFDSAPADLVRIGEWQHFALVMEMTEYTIFIDGEVQYTGPIPVGGEGPYVFPATGVTGDRTIGDGFRGWLEEFRISDEALTPDQFLNYQIPEPGTLVLTLVGLVALCIARRKVGRSL